MPSAFSSPIPSAPAYRAPGGLATDISGGVSAFAESLQEQRERAAVEAFRQAQLKLEEEKLRQEAGQGEMDRELKKYLGELQAEVERERNERIRTERERDRSSGEEASARDIRAEFQRQLNAIRETGARRGVGRLGELSGAKQRTPAEEEELRQLQGRSGQSYTGRVDPELLAPELTRADSIAAFDRAAASATGPYGSEAASRLREALGFNKSVVSGGGGGGGMSSRPQLEAEIQEALAAGVNYGRILSKVREDIRSGQLPPDAEQWAAEMIRREQGKRAGGAGGTF